jgi:hypothetical protein
MIVQQYRGARTQIVPKIDHRIEIVPRAARP